MNDQSQGQNAEHVPMQENNLKLNGWSDGSTADYYQLPPGATELQHLISGRDMNAQIGEIFRAAYRYGRAGHSSQLRDAKKMVFYAKAEVERLEKLGGTPKAQAGEGEPDLSSKMVKMVEQAELYRREIFVLRDVVRLRRRDNEQLRAELKAVLEELNALRAHTEHLKPVLWQYKVLGDKGQGYYWQTIDSSDAERRAVYLRAQGGSIRALAVVPWAPKPWS